MKELRQFAESIGFQVVDDNRRYWLVRTKGGKYFDDFYLDKYISIGWSMLNNLDSIKGGAQHLKEEVAKIYPEEKRPGYVANQIIRFVSEMKAGDIVLVPSENSKYLAFGELLDDNIYLEENESPEVIKLMESLDNDILQETQDTEALERCLDILGAEGLDGGFCPHVKRRKVKWHKTINRKELDPYLYKLLHSHNTISDASEYSSFIDRTLSSFFIKGDKVHSIVDVTETNEIPAVDTIQGVSTILESFDIFNELTGSDFDKKKVDMKISIQSPGPIEFSTHIMEYGVLIGMILIGVVGGSARFCFTPEKQEGNIETDGLLGKLLKFHQQLHSNKIEKHEKVEKYKRELSEASESLKLEVDESVKECEASPKNEDGTEER